MVITNNLNQITPHHTSPHPRDYANGLLELSDADVDAYLKESNPATHAYLNAAAKRDFAQSRMESASLTSPTRLTGESFADVLTSSATSSAESDQDKHWLSRLFPWMCKEEIMETVSVHLTYRECEMLRRIFLYGKTVEESAVLLRDKKFGPKRTYDRVTATRHLKAIKDTIYQKGREGLLINFLGDAEDCTDDPEDEEDQERDWQAGIESLMSAKTSYTPISSYRAGLPAAKVYACSCGHHLTNRHLDRDYKSYPNRERFFKCDICLKSWPKSQWPGLLC